MKKYKFTIHGNDYEVEIQDIEDDVATVEVNGSTYRVEIKSEVKTSKTPRLIRQRPVQHTDTTQKTSQPSAPKGAGFLKAPLPGTILELKKKVGDEVKSDDTILIMEAMKMENEIKSDMNGKIISIKVNVNDSVLEGDVLVEIGGN
jgi:biotin carboxyl carrier protein